ncbi:TorD/DmsD family molecular chaperone [Paenibacillus sanguinis]|uniref:TorD/DmsD family molecular chaperone n=1 Tax=Paenibacillus sanguinis TaxID=225906 RepID=UPI0003772B27|nr:molecular chaperone TorD family protein [Paenibacillus sanguinis]
MAMLFKPLVYTQEQVRWLETRGLVYHVLMDFLSRPPRMSLIAQWRHRLGMNHRIEGDEGWRKLRLFLESIDEDSFRRVCHQEAEEYTRLFTGHEAIVPACESIYRSRLEGENAVACIARVSKNYMDNGIVFNKLNGERDDHIALELEFMAVLAEGMLAKVNLQQSCLALADSQISFLRLHLLRWAHLFSRELLQATDSPLYQAVAELMDLFLTEDFNSLCAWRNSQQEAEH